LRFYLQETEEPVLEALLKILHSLSYKKFFQGHHEILDAMKRGNGPAARQAMRRHLEDVEDMLFKKKKKVSRT
jgi:DNA-binding GntR family transcriptional regulator